MTTSQSAEEEQTEEALPVQTTIKHEEEIDYNAETEEVETRNQEAEQEATTDDCEQLVDTIESEDAAVNVEFQGVFCVFCPYLFLNYIRIFCIMNVF